VVARSVASLPTTDAARDELIELNMSLVLLELERELPAPLKIKKATRPTREKKPEVNKGQTS
jgi:hypothetical protein